MELRKALDRSAKNVIAKSAETEAVGEMDYKPDTFFLSIFRRLNEVFL